MKRIITAIAIKSLAMSYGLMAWATPTVANVTAHQRYPWNGLVDIAVTIQGGGTTNDIEATKCTFTATNFITKASIPMVHVIQDSRTMGAGGAWELKYIWDAKADVGSIKIDDIVMTVNAEVLGVQLWENGPYWAECNIGAESPEEYGYYFWWGDTVGCCRNGSKWDAADGSQKGVLFKNCPTYTGKSNLLSIGYIDSIGKLVAAHDAATEYLGAPWRMPTRSDFDALIGNCTKEWAMRNGVYGLLVKGRGAYALRSIFLPAADKGTGTSTSIYSPGTTNSGGYYWSSSTSSTYDMYSYYMQFGCGQFFYVELRDSYDRCYGFPVRPLIGAVD